MRYIKHIAPHISLICGLKSKWVLINVGSVYEAPLAQLIQAKRL